MTADQFHVGDLVDVKQHGRATVAEVVSDPSQPHFGRVLVRYEEDGTTFYCNPNKLRKLTPSSRQVVVCYRTEHYRAAAVHNVERQDVCLEVGCHTGTTTRILYNRCNYVVGVDNVGLAVDQAREKHPGIRFELVDGLDIHQVKALSPTGTFTKVFVDLSGKAPLELIGHFLSLYVNAFPHSKIVVKNEALFRYLEELEEQPQQQGREPQQGQQAKRPVHARQQQEQSGNGRAAQQLCGQSVACQLPQCDDGRQLGDATILPQCSPSGELMLQARVQQSQQQHCLQQPRQPAQRPHQQQVEPMQQQQQQRHCQQQMGPMQQQQQLAGGPGGQCSPAADGWSQQEGGKEASLPSAHKASPDRAATSTGGNLPAALADVCELFRESYISHALKQHANRNKATYRGRQQRKGQERNQPPIVESVA